MGDLLGAAQRHTGSELEATDLARRARQHHARLAQAREELVWKRSLPLGLGSERACQRGDLARAALHLSSVWCGALELRLAHVASRCPQEPRAPARASRFNSLTGAATLPENHSCRARCARSSERLARPDCAGVDWDAHGVSPLAGISWRTMAAPVARTCRSGADPFWWRVVAHLADWP